MVDGHTSGIMQLALFLAEEGQPQGQGRVPTQPLNGEARTVPGHPLKLRLATQIHAQVCWIEKVFNKNKAKMFGCLLSICFNEYNKQYL